MTLLNDIRLAVRGLLRVPAFTTAAIVSLTLGIATSAVVFGLVDAALLRPLPFVESDRLMMLNITQTSLPRVSSASGGPGSGFSCFERT